MRNPLTITGTYPLPSPPLLSRRTTPELPAPASAPAFLPFPPLSSMRRKAAPPPTPDPEGEGGGGEREREREKEREREREGERERERVFLLLIEEKGGKQHQSCPPLLPPLLPPVPCLLDLPGLALFDAPQPTRGETMDGEEGMRDKRGVLRGGKGGRVA